MSSFLQRCRAALAHRRQVDLPPLAGLVVLLGSLLAIYVAVAVLDGPPGAREHHFVSERGLVTGLSAVLLAMASGFAAAAAFLVGGARLGLRLFWVLVALAFCFLALDELLEFHERVGHWIGKQGADLPDGFRNWNDIIVILYGVLSLPMLLAFLPQVLHYRRLAEFLALAFGFYVAHTAIDSLAVGMSTRAMIAEETCKLFASASFGLAMFIGLLGVIAEQRTRD